MKLFGGDQVLRTYTSVRDSPDRGEEQGNLPSESDGSPPPLQDSSPDDARNDFWSISGKYIHRHHVEPRVKLYVPKEESFPIPLRYIDVSRTTNTNLISSKSDASMIFGISRETETYQIRGLDSHDSPCWTNNLQMGIHGPGGG